MDNELKAALIQELMKEIKKETDKIMDNINDKHAQLEKKLDIVERKLESVEETAHKALNQAVTNRKDFVETNNTVKEQQKEINTLKATLNDQIDRSLRSTLIFKGIPCEKTENSWEDTKNTLMNYLSTTFKWNSNDLNKDIERAHRGKVNRQGSKNEQSDAIYVKFGSWAISEAIKKEVIKANRTGFTNVIVTQMYSKATTDIINDKLMKIVLGKCF